MPRLGTSQRDNILEAIKQSARRQMETEGTGALSLRGIARDLAITAPALYRYFPTRDDLITTLILDAFNALADALEAARDQHLEHPLTRQLLAASIAYRAWAVAHPSDFQLIYGNPIVGYEAPREITVPAVVRGFRLFVGLIEGGIQNGEIIPTAAYQALPSTLETHFQQMIAEGDYPISTTAISMGIVCWTQIHGMIMLELYGHLPPTVGDTEYFYRWRMETLAQEMGMNLSP